MKITIHTDRCGMPERLVTSFTFTGTKGPWEIAMLHEADDTLTLEMLESTVQDIKRMDPCVS